MALALGRTKSSFCLINNLLKLTVSQPSRQFKSALKIKWVRPETIFSVKPEMSGDLAPLGTVDMTQLPTTHKPSQELQSADEIIQRLYSLEFFPRQKLKEELMTQYTNRVKAHKLDDDSPEVKIAKLTVKIRNLQIHYQQFPRDKINKVRLKEAIDKRNKQLTLLRSADYKKFEWLLDKMDLEYKVFGYNAHERVERKRSLRRLTALYIEKIKSERLTEYKYFLESQKPGFLQDKLDKLTWIKKTEEECGITATVTDADVEAVRQQLQNLQVVKPKEIEE